MINAFGQLLRNHPFGSQFQFKVVHVMNGATRLRVTTGATDASRCCLPCPQLVRDAAGGIISSWARRSISGLPSPHGATLAALIQSWRTNTALWLCVWWGFSSPACPGVCRHRLWHTPVWLAAALTGLFCGGLALLFAAQAIAFDPARKYPYDMADYWCLARGSARWLKLASRRLPLGLCGLWLAGFAIGRLDSGGGCLWHLLAGGHRVLFRRGT